VNNAMKFMMMNVMPLSVVPLVVVAAMNCCDSEPSGEAEVELEFQLLPKAVLEQAGQVRLFP
jgi:hypothetical protein